MRRASLPCEQIYGQQGHIAADHFDFNDAYPVGQYPEAGAAQHGGNPPQALLVKPVKARWCCLRARRRANKKAGSTGLLTSAPNGWFRNPAIWKSHSAWDRRPSHGDRSCKIKAVAHATGAGSVPRIECEKFVEGGTGAMYLELIREFAFRPRPLGTPGAEWNSGDRSRLSPRREPLW